MIATYPKRKQDAHEDLVFESGIRMVRSLKRLPSEDYQNCLYSTQPFHVIRVVTWVVCLGGMDRWIGSDEHSEGDYGVPNLQVTRNGLVQAHRAGLIERVIAPLRKGTLALYRIRDMRGGQ